MASNFLSQLIGKETGLVKERIIESLAAKMAKAQKKEGKWRGLQSVLKTVANVALPGVGGAILGAAIDPIGRHFGAGAKASDIQATGDENLFGGRKAFTTAQEGLTGSIDEYKQANITNSIAGFAGGQMGYNPAPTGGYAQGGMIQRFIDGGMVQKYQQGGQIQHKIAPNVRGLMATGSTGKGINDFLRTPAVANLVNNARSGDQEAMRKLIEMSRQSLPELRNIPHADLEGEFKKSLTNIDLYGQGYKDVLSGTETTLEGLQTGAQGARAQAASGAATSGIRTGGGGFKGAESISEGLHSQAGQEYGKMQKGIQSSYDESFGGLETAILGLGG